MRHASISMSDIVKAGGRLDSQYHLALADLAKQTVGDRSLTDHLRATFTQAAAMDLLHRLPSEGVADALRPLVTGDKATLSANRVIEQVVAKLPFEALGLVWMRRETLRVECDLITAKAKVIEDSMDDLGNIALGFKADEPKVARRRRSP
jgi:hypothetical protein